VSRVAGAVNGRPPQSASAIQLVLIAAVAENGIIGRANQLPWRLKSDMAHFRNATMNHPVVMGRKTFQSLGKPLVGRTNIVVTRDPAFTASGAVIAGSLAAALAAARGDALRRGAPAIMVAGGAEIYAEALPLADRLLITLVHERPEGDAAFPTIEPSMWRETERIEHPAGAGDSAGVAYLRFERADRADYRDGDALRPAQQAINH